MVSLQTDRTRLVGAIDQVPIYFEDLLSQLPSKEKAYITEQCSSLTIQEEYQLSKLLEEFIKVFHSHHEGPLENYIKERSLWLNDKLANALVFGIYHGNLSLQEFSTACLWRSVWRVEKAFKAHQYMPIFDQNGNATAWTMKYLNRAGALKFHNTTARQVYDISKNLDPRTTLLTADPLSIATILNELKKYPPSESYVLMRKSNTDEESIIQHACRGFGLDSLLHAHSSIFTTEVEDVIPSKGLVDAFIKVAGVAINQHFGNPSRSFPLCPVIGASLSSKRVTRLITDRAIQPMSLPLVPLVNKLPENPDDVPAIFESCFSRHDLIHGTLRQFLRPEAIDFSLKALYPALEALRDTIENEQLNALQALSVDMQINSRTARGQMIEFCMHYNATITRGDYPVDTLKHFALFTVCFLDSTSSECQQVFESIMEESFATPPFLDSPLFKELKSAYQASLP